METDPPRQSWIGRNIHVIVWMILAVITALGVSWLMTMPPGVDRSPAPMQASQPQSPPVAATGQGATDEKAADERAWAETSRAGSLAAFESYVRAHPSGAHVAEAQQRVAALQEEARRATEAARAAAQKAAEDKAAEEKVAADKAADDRAWTEATQAGAMAAFEAYARAHPSGAHVAEARQRIAALQEEARRAAETAARAAAQKAAEDKAAADKATDDRAWAEATQLGSVAAFETYIRNNTAGARIAEAQQRIAALNTQARQAAEAQAAAERAAAEKLASEKAAAEREAARAAADERAWVEAAQAGTIAALESYVRNHPAGTRVADAQQRIAVINEQARHEQEQRAMAERLAAERAAAEKVAAERALDDQAFAQATRTGSIEGYETYIRNNGAGAHVMEASQRIAHLRAAAEKKNTGAKAAAGRAPRDRTFTYVPQRPVYKAPPMSALR